MLEACILGTLFVAAMTIFRMPYALLVGVLIALTALIPIVGAFIGWRCGRTAHRHRRSLEGAVVHRAVPGAPADRGKPDLPPCGGFLRGAASIWVLAAVTLGGKLMGITGMLFFIRCAP